MVVPTRLDLHYAGGSDDRFRRWLRLFGAPDMGGVWDYEALNGFLANPKGWAPGTKMAYRGLKDTQDRADLVAYLRGLSDRYRFPVSHQKSCKGPDQPASARDLIPSSRHGGSHVHAVLCLTKCVDDVGRIRGSAQVLDLNADIFLRHE